MPTANADNATTVEVDHSPSNSVGHRLIVFTGDLNYTVRRNIVDLDIRVPLLEWLVLVHSPPRSMSRLVKSQIANIRKHGWRWVSYQFGDIVARLAQRRHADRDPHAPGSEFELSALVARPNLRIRRVADIHADESMVLAREFTPDLGLSLAAPILRPELFNVPRLGTINLHKGKLPEFRGMPPAFWELWTGQSSVGCSVHWVSEKLDAGPLLRQAQLPCERWSTPRGMRLQLDELGVALMCHATQEVLSTTASATVQQSGVGRTYRKPSLAQEAKLQQRLTALLPIQQPALKRALKDLYARYTFAWHRWIGWRIARPRITVLLYHRVSDDARDNLTVGVEQFGRQMNLLREHCEVLSISQMLASSVPKRSRRPLVAVTFDDGYLDNYSNAAPILRRHCIPCAFFVSTGIVASNRQFPHDERRGNPPIEMMNWDQLRRMRDWGFTIGSHTVEHIDCVSENEDRVRSELARSRDDLARELGATSLLFAYPYGGRNQMNEERLALVRAAGFEACLSAYGGSNVGSVDRWNVLRRGIHWEFSDASFLRQCLGV